MTDTTITTRTCPYCGQGGQVIVPQAGYDAWKAGEYIQVALADVSVGDREQLISGCHSACFDILFPPDDDDG